MNNKATSEKKMKFSRMLLFGILPVLLFLFFILDLLLGSVRISPADVVKTILGTSVNEVWQTIIFDFRIPKAVVAILAGAALSLSGLQMQTIFRNPLAGPYVLGISSGASLGVAVMVLGASALGVSNLSGVGVNFSIVGAAWLGALAVLLLILAVSVRVKDIMTILILGMMFGSAASALVSVLQFFGSESMLKAFVIWTMGSLSSVTGMQLWVFSIAIFIGLVICFLSIRLLDVMLLGEAYSKSVGLNVNAARMLIFISTSLLAGSVTAFCGPIGFIGIAVPHIARMLFKTANHAVLVPGVLLLGSIVLLFSDIVSQLPGFVTTLPLNAVTSLLGIPVVIYVVVKNRKFTGL